MGPAPSFAALFTRYDWEEIPGCPGRYRLRGGPSILSPGEILDSNAALVEYNVGGARDPVIVAAFPGGGLISYRRPAGTYVHTLNDSGGFARKLAALGIRSHAIGVGPEMDKGAHHTAHHTAVVDPGARLGAGVSVGAYAIVEADTCIGDGSELRSHSVVKRYTSVDAECLVHEGAVIGGEPQDTSFTDCRSYLEIGPRNRIRECVTIHRASRPGAATKVGAGCFIMAGAHVAHDCVLGDGVILANNVALAGHVEIEDRAFLSGGVVVHQFCRIGKLAMVGGNSKIVQDCLPFVITDGVPGRARGLNLVGLRRAGLGRGEIAELKTAFKLLLRSGLRLEAALDEMAEFQSASVRHLAAFVKRSERGFCHALKESGQG